MADFDDVAAERDYVIVSRSRDLGLKGNYSKSS
jgi:hypothetical protein